jgi:hypothetical protein
MGRHAECSSEMLVTTYRTLLCHYPEDYIKSLQRRQNFKSHILKQYSVRWIVVVVVVVVVVAVAAAAAAAEAVVVVVVVVVVAAAAAATVVIVLIMVVVMDGRGGAGGAGCSCAGAGKIQCNFEADRILFTPGWHSCIPQPWPWRSKTKRRY